MLRIDGALEVSDLETRVGAIVEHMGFQIGPIDEPTPVPRWFGTGDVDELSQEEARVLAARWVDELEQEHVLVDARRLLEPLRETLLQAFRDASRTGSVDALRIDDAAIRDAVGETAGAKVRDWLGHRLTVADHG